VFLLPVIKQFEPPSGESSQIEIQIQYESRPAVIEFPDETVAAPSATNQTPVRTVEAPPPKPARILTKEPPPVSVLAETQTVPSNDRPENPADTDISQLSRTLLSRQFINEPSVTDEIFGPKVEAAPAEAKEFHFPLQTNMITMLDKPIPNLPFEYTPDLVHFAYEPGVKGDMQRFWDKITPEFGWRTNYGTEVKCVWVLVIAACGWGRSK